MIGGPAQNPLVDLLHALHVPIHGELTADLILRPGPSRPAQMGSACTANTASAIARGSPGGTNRPSWPCSTISTTPPPRVATTGLPAAIPSMITRPKGSGVEAL